MMLEMLAALVIGMGLGAAFTVAIYTRSFERNPEQWKAIMHGYEEDKMLIEAMAKLTKDAA